MAKVLIVGCGDLGSEIARLLAGSGHDVIGVRASNKSLQQGIRCIQADVTQFASLKSLEDILPDIVIYCVAANAQTNESYQAHYVDGLRNVMATQVNNRQLKHIFFVSSTRVYGQLINEELNENTPAMPNDYGGERLLDAENLLKNLSCGATAVRLSGIYGPGRQYLVNMAQDINRWPRVDRWTNRIHRDDAARFIVFLSEKVIRGERIQDCYIGTDDKPVLLYEVLSWLAIKLNVEVATINDGSTVEGKRLSNQRMHDVGFQLTYPNYQFGYSELLKDV
jgi:nucleoside-diphosphate-sugar epimerase